MLTIETIKKALKEFLPEKLADDGSVKGAVIVPIFQKSQQLYLLVTKRTQNVSMHKGQISFPGGKIEPQDKSLLHCALRETFEEIGIEEKFITFLGALDQIKTYGSNVLLSPFVCKIHYPFRLALNKHEVETVIEIPFEALLKQENWHMEHKTFTDQQEMPIYYFTYKEWLIWGATAKILYQLVELIKEQQL